MDTYRGNFIDHAGPDLDTGDDDYAREAPPAVIGQDERRMQVRAYNHWAGLLDNRNFPSIEDLEPEALPDFGPYSVLLDFSTGIDNPAIRFLGTALAEECGASTRIATLADVPSRSLLSRITDHYMQILANQAPIGFEAEFVNQREKTILYRGILLPFSSDDDTIDFIYGVINWKELVDQQTSEALLQEIDRALETRGPDHRHDELTDWADGPADAMRSKAPADEGILDLGAFPNDDDGLLAFPEPDLGESDAAIDLAWIEPASAPEIMGLFKASTPRAMPSATTCWCTRPVAWWVATCWTCASRWEEVRTAW